MKFQLDRSRRRLLITATWLAMTAPGTAFSVARAPFPFASTAQHVVSLFSNASSAAAIGRRYIAATDRELTPDRVLAELDLQNMTGIDDTRLRRHLAARSSADYEEGRTVQLDGWMVFVGMEEIAGFSSRLVQGMRELGVEADLFLWEKHPFDYQGQKTRSWSLRVARAARLAERHLRPWKLWNKGRLIADKVFLESVARNYDAFIFGFDSSIVSHEVDLPLLRSLDKKVAYLYFGSDARPPFIGKSSHSQSVAQIIRETQHKKQRIRAVEAYADVVVVQSECAHLFEKQYVPFMLVGIPAINNTSQPVKAAIHHEGPVRLLHSPSNPTVKGTTEIRDAIEQVKERGRSIDYVEIVGRPHSEVLRELERCDFVVDQVYSDTPLAGLATEAASFGKATVVGRYAVDHVKSTYPADAIPPSQFCRPDELVNAIDELIVNEDFRVELGQRARKFVMERWTPKAVAARLMELAAGTVSATSLYDPSQVRYVHGLGLSEEMARARVRDILNEGGREALQMSDKPELEQRFADFARGD